MLRRGLEPFILVSWMLLAWRQIYFIIIAVHVTRPLLAHLTHVYTLVIKLGPQKHSRLLDQLPRRTLHPQLRVKTMRKLQELGLRASILALRRGIYKHRLEVKRRHLSLIVLGDLHGEKAVRGSGFADMRRVTTSHDNLIIRMFHNLKMIHDIRSNLIRTSFQVLDIPKVTLPPLKRAILPLHDPALHPETNPAPNPATKVRRQRALIHRYLSPGALDPVLLRQLAVRDFLDRVIDAGWGVGVRVVRAEHGRR